jgi:hypothetical protein
LHFLEKFNGYLCFGVVINTGGINVKNLPIKYFFRSPDIPDTLQELFPITASSKVFETFIVHGEALANVFVEAPGGPNSELSTT